jgi:YHS domain-containing protein
MNRWSMVTGFVGMLALGAGLLAAGSEHKHGEHQHGDKSDKPALPLCPVMGTDPINLSVRVATDDGPVFFCCKGCIDKYKANPEKYAEKVKAQRKALASLAKVQVTCPVTKKPVNKKVFVEHEGQKVYFCCKGCVGKFEKDPAKYEAALANSYTYQTRCPVMNEDINPKAFIELADGRKVFFCCKGCDKKLTKDPEKYLPNLESQGIHISEKQLASAHGEKEGEHAGHKH